MNTATGDLKYRTEAATWDNNEKGIKEAATTLLTGRSMDAGMKQFTRIAGTERALISSGFIGEEIDEVDPFLFTPGERGGGTFKFPFGTDGLGRHFDQHAELPRRGEVERL